MKTLCLRRKSMRIVATAAALVLLGTMWPENCGHLAAETKATVTRPTTESIEAKPADLRPIRPPYKDGEVLVCNFNHLKFAMKLNSEFKLEMLTKEIAALSGKKVRIRGWVVPTTRQKLTKFVLVRDNQECCFGPGAMLYDCIQVTMKPGTFAQYTTFPIEVEGVFSVDVWKDELDGTTMAIYHLEGESAR